MKFRRCVGKRRTNFTRINLGIVMLDEMWNKLKEGIEMVAQEICGKDKQSNKQNWMNSR